MHSIWFDSRNQTKVVFFTLKNQLFVFELSMRKAEVGTKHTVLKYHNISLIVTGATKCEDREMLTNQGLIYILLCSNCVPQGSDICIRIYTESKTFDVILSLCWSLDFESVAKIISICMQ